MSGEINLIVEAADESMQFSIEHLEKELVNIRAGKANPVMLKGITIEYYGTPTLLARSRVLIPQMEELLLFNRGKNRYLLKLKKEF